MAFLICSKCGKKKIEIEFSFRKDCNKYRNHCKACMCEKSRKWYQKNREEITDKKREYNREHYRNNKEKVKKQQKKYREKNIEKKREYNKEYYRNNKEKFRSSTKKHRKTIKGRINHNISTAIYTSLVGNKNGRHWEDIVGYTIQELIEHLENNSEFTIQNYLEKDLHINHIIPQSLYSFKSYEDEEFKKCWDLRNLRLITARKNLSKNNTLDINLIRKFNLLDLLPNGEKNAS